MEIWLPIGTFFKSFYPLMVYCSLFLILCYYHFLSRDTGLKQKWLPPHPGHTRTLKSTGLMNKINLRPGKGVSLWIRWNFKSTFFIEQFRATAFWFFQLTSNEKKTLTFFAITVVTNWVTSCSQIYFFSIGNICLMYIEESSVSKPGPVNMKKTKNFFKGSLLILDTITLNYQCDFMKLFLNL